MMFGRKLDIVCSVQPYGYDVRYCRAAKIVPATDGASSTRNVREVCSEFCGKTMSCVVSSSFFEIDPAFGTAIFTPYGITGNVSSIASDSSSVSALVVSVLSRTLPAFTLQSTFTSPLL